MSSLSFSIWQFAAAGAVLAVGPLVIHLLNRRRFRVVQWAAMDFLREALQRNRRIMQIRDLLLLLLRTAAVLLFGLALAQPFFSSSSENLDSKQPVHAVLLVDNSMSMGYQMLGESLLDQAKQRAREFIEKLPKGSRVSIIPLCGSRHGYSLDPYSTAQAANEALTRIEVVDRAASVSRALNEAKRACESAPQLAKRLVLLSDQQAANWRDLDGVEQLRGMPSLQVVDCSAGPDYENTWISDLRLQDGVADVETPTTIVVQLQHRGRQPRNDVQVALQVDGVEVAAKTITLDAAQGAREVQFQYSFSAYQPEPGQPVMVPLVASLAPDRLPDDDERHLVAPVVAALPVVFVDQYGAEENALRNRLGETRHLRKLLAPITSRTESRRQLVKIRHLTIDQLDRDSLADARLVVVAGVRDPGSAVPLLRDYVRQGGQLITAAGGDFDADAWNRAAWLDGQGILPVRLESEPLGTVPEEAGASLRPYFLSFESLMGHQYFQLAGVSEENLRSLYAEPLFFKMIGVDVSRQAIEEFRKKELARQTGEWEFWQSSEQRLKEWEQVDSEQELTPEQSSRHEADVRRRLELEPNWLTWRPAIQSSSWEQAIHETGGDPVERDKRLREFVHRSLPRVLARLTDEQGPAVFVERRIGLGNSLFVATGVLSNWNTLPKTNAIVIFDRMLREMILSTLPQRNYEPRERLTLPMESADRDLMVRLRRPGEEQAAEVVDTGFIGKDQVGVTIPSALARGIYRLSAYASPLAASAKESSNTPIWETALAVNGPADESDLQVLPPQSFEQLSDAGRARWVGPGEEIRVDGVFTRGQNSWWYLILFVLFLLLLELAILAWPLMVANRSSVESH